jgi:hypothetical protein
MGYTTDFSGAFQLNKPLTVKDFTFLKKLNETRRMARNVDESIYGIQGEFYVDGGGFMGQGEESNIINYNQPPRTQPGLWCKWTPNEDGTAIEWDGREKFYNYVEWIKYIIDKILSPRGYVLNGEVKWYGEDRDDEGIICIVDNVVTTKSLSKTFY